MSIEELEKEFPEILTCLQDYALVRNTTGIAYTIYNVKDQAYVLVDEYFDELITLMLKRGVKVVNSMEEVVNPDHKFYVMRWDEEKRVWVKTPK
jgi:hypothetical protein